MPPGLRTVQPRLPLSGCMTRTDLCLWHVRIIYRCLPSDEQAAFRALLARLGTHVTSLHPVAAACDAVVDIRSCAQPASLTWPLATAIRRVTATASSIRRSWVTRRNVPG
jgi:hypothetical protein